MTAAELTAALADAEAFERHIELQVRIDLQHQRLARIRKNWVAGIITSGSMARQRREINREIEDLTRQQDELAAPV